MPIELTPVPAQTLKNIEIGSRRVKRLATELSERVKVFEVWLNDLPGKTEATLWLNPPESRLVPLEFGLSLRRAAKRWNLFFGYTNATSGRTLVDWCPLAEASVEIKLYAVKHFPQLLAQITKAHETLVKDLEAAHREFDAFANAIGLAQQKEGK